MRIWWPLCALAFTVHPQLIRNHVSEFDSIPYGMVYFESSPTLLLQSGSRIFKSDNDGESFGLIDSIQDVYSMIQHPSDPSTVMVFTAKDNWITEDKGTNWRKLEFPIPVSRTGSFVSFNSADKQKMIVRLRFWSGKAFTEEVAINFN